MIGKVTSNYEKGKSKKIKLLALCIRAITGVLGASMIITKQHPYLTLTILSIGAAADEIIKFIPSEEQAPQNPPQP